MGLSPATSPHSYRSLHECVRIVSLHAHLSAGAAASASSFTVCRELDAAADDYNDYIIQLSFSFPTKLSVSRVFALFARMFAISRLNSRTHSYATLVCEHMNTRSEHFSGRVVLSESIDALRKMKGTGERERETESNRCEHFWPRKFFGNKSKILMA